MRIQEARDMTADPTPEIDSRFSDPEAGPTPWPDAARALEQAELYWLTTVRADGRPHVTPLIGVTRDGAMHFCTGLREQKARNLEYRSQVALTTGNNAWAQGLDVVIEGTAVRVIDDEALRSLADAYEAKYGPTWHFDVGDRVFGAGQDAAAVFRIEPDKVLAFAKEPHAQTTYRFTDR
jgi:pyridoxine/pyridoxamine 5'-phosphate oxidase